MAGADAPADPAAAADSDAANGGTAPPPEKPLALIPDDYSLVHGDCVQLSQRYAALTRSDHAASLSPRLTPEQRARTEERIDVVAKELGNRYLKACEQNVGKSVDPKAMKCAFDARTVKAFDDCLNGPSPAH